MNFLGSNFVQFAGCHLQFLAAAAAVSAMVLVFLSLFFFFFCLLSLCALAAATACNSATEFHDFLARFGIPLLLFGETAVFPGFQFGEMVSLCFRNRSGMPDSERVLEGIIPFRRNPGGELSFQIDVKNQNIICSSKRCCKTTDRQYLKWLVELRNLQSAIVSLPFSIFLKMYMVKMQIRV